MRFGALGVLFSINKTSVTYLEEPRLSSKSQDPYIVDFKYVFHGVDPVVLQAVENRLLAKIINSKYIMEKKIKQIDVNSGGERIIFTFSSEESYLCWEKEMVLSKVINRNICFRIDSSEALSGGINKVVYLHVGDEKKWV